MASAAEKRLSTRKKAGANQPAPSPQRPTTLSELKPHLKEEDSDLRHNLEDLIRSLYLQY